MKRIINSELEVERKPLHKLSINWADVPFKNCTPMYPVKTEKKMLIGYVDVSVINYLLHLFLI